jgi:hypothetical protein
LKTDYLTYEKSLTTTVPSFQNVYISVSLFLSDKKQIRTRTVYDVITLIAEVSGFADLFVLGFGSLIGLIYSPKALDAEVLNHMKFQVNKKKKLRFPKEEPETIVLD